MIEIGIALLLVAANGFFVASEFAIARIRDTQVTEFEALGRKGAGSLRHAVDHIDAYLAACQLGITLASIGLGFVGKPAFEQLVEPLAGPLGDAIPGVTAYALSFAFAYAIVTLLHVVFGELSPKSLAIARTAKTSLALAPPMRAFYMSTKPLVDGFNALGNLVLRPFGIPTVREAGHAPHSEDELRALLRQSEQGGLIEPEEREIAERAFEFSEGRVMEAMVPRHEIVAVAESDGIEAARQAMIASGHSRLPVASDDGGIDRPVGVVNAMDLLASGSAADALADVIRPVTIVPEATSLVELLATLRGRRQHMAVVADEHGTTQGLITVEDVVERVFGEIYDEFDAGLSVDDPRQITTEDDGSLTMPGVTPLHELARRGVVLPTGDFTTVAGLVLAELGALPDPGARALLDEWTITVLDVDGTTIRRVRIERNGSDD